MGDYSGSEWIQNNYKHSHPSMVMSDLGKHVADLLGELFYGIYHINQNSLDRVNWENQYHIEISIGWTSWSTFDFSNLTRLVFLAHHRAIRVDLSPCNFTHIELMFHQRSRSKEIARGHPTLDDAVKTFKKDVTLEELK